MGVLSQNGIAFPKLDQRHVFGNQQKRGDYNILGVGGAAFRSDDRPKKKKGPL